MMQQLASEHLGEKLAALDPSDPQYATEVVDRILAAARSDEASDLHLQPAADALELKFRIDGVLRPVTTFPARAAVNVVSRLKVRADLLTYQTDRPQEGASASQAATSRCA